MPISVGATWTHVEAVTSAGDKGLGVYNVGSSDQALVDAAIGVAAVAAALANYVPLGAIAAGVDILNDLNQLNAAITEGDQQQVMLANAPYSVAAYVICTGTTARFKGINRRCKRQKQHSQRSASRSTAKTPYAISARVAGQNGPGRRVDNAWATSGVINLLIRRQEVCQFSCASALPLNRQSYSWTNISINEAATSTTRSRCISRNLSPQTSSTTSQENNKLQHLFSGWMY